MILRQWILIPREGGSFVVLALVDYSAVDDDDDGRGVALGVVVVCGEAGVGVVCVGGGWMW